MSTSRETVRDALVALLTPALVGAGLPVKTVTGSKVAKFEGLTPLVAVLSAGSDRPRPPFHGARAELYLEVLVFVRQAVTGWTNAQAEDALDRIESLIAGVYETNVATANWEMVDYDGRTTVLEIEAGDGTLYYLERIPTVVRLARS